MNSTRREWLHRLGLSSLGSALGLSTAHAQVSGQAMLALPAFTGPQMSAYWGALGPLATYPQKLPLILLTDRPVQLETPRAYFQAAITPNAAFYVRWHLDGHPQEVNLAHYRLQVEGAVQKPLALSFEDLLGKFEPVSVVAVNQCSGNSRSHITPRVAGSQWGHGAMGCARWTGVRLRDLLRAAVPKAAATAVQFEGLERGRGPQDKAAFCFLKSLSLTPDLLDNCILAYAMNGEPLPLLNGFPLRVVVPGYFATYWVKALGTLRLLDKPDDTYWMKTAYRMPDTPDGSTTPEELASGKVQKVPIGRMPVRSLIVAPDGSAKLPVGFPFLVRGIAFSGHGAVTRVEVSSDGGVSWKLADLGEDLGPHAFRTWSFAWRPSQPGKAQLVVRATDAAGHTQSDAPFWNPGGYGYARLDRQEVMVGLAG